MIDAQPPETRNPKLDSWIEIATRRLGEQSCRRIQEDIDEHYSEAVEAGLAAGLSATDAADAAINGLGDPRAAGRRFRRSHLSRFDERLVRDICRKPPRFLLWICLGVLAFTALLYSVSLDSRLEFVSAAALLLTMAVGMVALFRIAPAFVRRGRLRAATATGPLGLWLFFTAANVGAAFLRGEAQAVVATIHAVAFVVLTVLYVPLWIKLRNRDRDLA